MKRIMLTVAAIALLTVMVPAGAVVLAGPPEQPNYGVVDPVGLVPPGGLWGDEEKIIPAPSTPSGEVHIVADPLMVAWPTDNTTKGWTTFWCQSRLGFQYNIGATGLTPKSWYNVHAVGVSIEVYSEDPGGGLEIEPGVWIKVFFVEPVGGIQIAPGLWIVPSGVIDLDLGKFRSDANGSGGVNGV